MNQRRPLSVLILVLYIVGSCTSIRNLSSMALFGPSVVFYYAVAACGFLIPTALVTAELGLRSPRHSGIFAWCHDFISPKAGLLAIWLQWINTMTWYPSVLAFIVSIIAYLVDPKLATHPMFMLSCILGIYWTLTLINCFGVQLSATFASICTVLGLLIPMLCLIGFAWLWIYQGHPITTTLAWRHLIPTHWHDLQLSAITPTITSCLGMELIAIYAPLIQKPARSIPRALIYSCQLIAVSTILGALAIAMVIPHHQLNLIAGTLQTFEIFVRTMHLTWLLPTLMVSILIGATGGMMNWMLSPAEGLRQASAAGLLPTWFSQTNRHQAPQRILLIQAILVSIVSIVFILMPNLNTAYWLLTDLSTELYLCMYPMLFLVAYKMLRLRGDKRLLNNHWLMGLSLVGLLTCCLGLYAGFIPPMDIGFQNSQHYALWFGLGMAGMVAPVVIFSAKHSAKAVGNQP